MFDRIQRWQKTDVSWWISVTWVISHNFSLFMETAFQLFAFSKLPRASLCFYVLYLSLKNGNQLVILVFLWQSQNHLNMQTKSLTNRRHCLFTVMHPLPFILWALWAMKYFTRREWCFYLCPSFNHHQWQPFFHFCSFLRKPIYNWLPSLKQQLLIPARSLQVFSCFGCQPFSPGSLNYTCEVFNKHS